MEILRQVQLLQRFAAINSKFGNVYYIDQSSSDYFCLMRIDEHSLRHVGPSITFEGILIKNALCDKESAQCIFCEYLENYHKVLEDNVRQCEDVRFSAINSKFGGAYDIRQGVQGDYRLVHYQESDPSEIEITEDCPEDYDLHYETYAYRYYSVWLENLYNEIHND